MEKIKVCSLFSGIGGFEMGIEQALGDGFETVFACEIDKFASKSYEILHGLKPFHDVTEVNPKELPDFDLLVGGFPCQDFSIAGKRNGLEGTRGTLFYEIARIAKEKQPKVMILENVKGILNHNKGETFKTVIETLESIGYTVKWKLLNSKNFGVAQNRERVYFICSLDEGFDFTFPEGTNTYARLKDILEESVDEKFYLSEEYHQRFIPKQRNNEIIGVGYIDNKYKDKDLQAVFSVEGIAPCLTVSGADERKIMVEGSVEIEGWFEQSRRIHNTEGLSPTLAARSDTTKIIEPSFRLRKLTPLECFRLQGFSDENYYILKENGISNTQLYKMAGNAVTTNVIEALVRSLYSDLLGI